MWVLTGVIWGVLKSSSGLQTLPMPRYQSRCFTRNMAPCLLPSQVGPLVCSSRLHHPHSLSPATVHIRGSMGGRRSGHASQGSRQADFQSSGPPWAGSGNPSFTHLFIQHMLKCLLCASHCSWHWGVSVYEESLCSQFWSSPPGVRASESQKGSFHLCVCMLTRDTWALQTACHPWLYYRGLGCIGIGGGVGQKRSVSSLD